MTSVQKNTNKFILFDTHVHIYDCYDLEKFMDSALHNFIITAKQLFDEESFSAFLLLAESGNFDWFSRFRAYAKYQDPDLRESLGKWKFQLTADETALRAVNNNGNAFYIVGGRQIVTEENLEVLALATTARFKDGNSLESVIKSVLSVAALPVIPWSFGKWFGKRGKLLEHFLKQANYSSLFLGDTGTRPSFWPNPSHFQLAEKRGIRILRGTDPLPLPNEAWRPGSYGCMICERVDNSRPSTHLKELLRNSKTNVMNYGKLESLGRFLRNQFSLRLKKFRRK